MFVDIEGSGRPVIVHRISGDEAAAFSSKCTHTGCKIELSKNDRVICKCRNPVFDGRGKRISGPASRDLEQLNAKLKSNTMVTTLR